MSRGKPAATHCWRLLQTDSPFSPPVLYFNSPQCRLLVNVPDGAQRLCLEEKLKLSNPFSTVYLTRIDPIVAGGLIGLTLTIADMSASTGSKLTLYGPRGLNAFFASCRGFARTAHLNIIEPNTSGRCDPPQTPEDWPTAHFIAPAVLLGGPTPSPLPVEAAASALRAVLPPSHPLHENIHHLAITYLSDLSDSCLEEFARVTPLVFRHPDEIPTLDPARAAALGVRRGPSLGLLKKGISVPVDEDADPLPKKGIKSVTPAPAAGAANEATGTDPPKVKRMVHPADVLTGGGRGASVCVLDVANVAHSWLTAVAVALPAARASSPELFAEWDSAVLDRWSATADCADAFLNASLVAHAAPPELHESTGYRLLSALCGIRHAGPVTHAIAEHHAVPMALMAQSEMETAERLACDGESDAETPAGAARSRKGDSVTGGDPPAKRAHRAVQHPAPTTAQPAPAASAAADSQEMNVGPLYSPAKCGVSARGTSNRRSALLLRHLHGLLPAFFNGPALVARSYAMTVPFLSHAIAQWLVGATPGAPAAACGPRRIAIQCGAPGVGYCVRQQVAVVIPDSTQSPPSVTRAPSGNADGPDVGVEGVVPIPMSPPPATAPHASGVWIDGLILGTGAAAPSKYRNVSAVLVTAGIEPRTPAVAETSPAGQRHGHGAAMLLDCGEGSAGQVARFSGPRMLSTITHICITHLHADHHMGLATVLWVRQALLGADDEKAARVVICAPQNMVAFITHSGWFDAVVEDADGKVIAPAEYMGAKGEWGWRGYGRTSSSRPSSSGSAADGADASLAVVPSISPQPSATSDTPASPRWSASSSSRSIWSPLAPPPPPMDNRPLPKVIVRVVRGSMDDPAAVITTVPVAASGADAPPAALCVKSFAVDHCPDSFGFAVHPVAAGGTGAPSFPAAVVYSGDTTAPCASLVDASKGAGVILHEATFDDSHAVDAAKKKHSTVSGVVTAAERASAAAVMLTHFSQRFPKAPPSIAAPAAAADGASPEELPTAFPVAVAFDGMQFPILPVPAVVHACFAVGAVTEQLASLEEHLDGSA